ncbi:MAG TPA: OmpA family protein [Bacteroidales bacterium]|nr:OmpA family protein [Bacteroidales bacterium]
MKNLCLAGWLLFTGVLETFCLLPVSVLAQNDLAPVKVSVTDMQGKPRSGEKILFIDSLSRKTFSGISDARGEFRLKLPAGAIYLIHIQTIGEDLEHSTFEIPKLKPGEYYDGESVVKIKFDPPREFVLDNVYFDTGKATLRAASYAELNELVEFMKLKPAVKIEIGGHTDDVGDDASNLKLSQQRADAVKNYLAGKGIARDRVVAVGYGETQPVASNDTPEGRQQNRRTEVKILSD